MYYEGLKLRAIIGPDEENIIDISKPDKRFAESGLYTGAKILCSINFFFLLRLNCDEHNNILKIE